MGCGCGQDSDANATAEQFPAPPLPIHLPDMTSAAMSRYSRFDASEHWPQVCLIFPKCPETSPRLPVEPSSSQAWSSHAPSALP